ncbi:MAG: hypothetical protein WEB88_06425 [Gemmatimonadota bacterium]
MLTIRTSTVLVCVLCAGCASVGGRQDRTLTAEQAREEAAALEVAHAALAAISREDMVAFTDLMIDEALVLPVWEQNGTVRYNARTRAAERARTLDADIVERGFDPTVRVSGPVASVWLPYDLYIDGAWSHCGVDTFTMVRVDGAWRIASLAWTVEQPPQCRRHPDGPPP